METDSRRWRHEHPAHSYWTDQSCACNLRTDLKLGDSGREQLRPQHRDVRGIWSRYYGISGRTTWSVGTSDSRFWMACVDSIRRCVGSGPGRPAGRLLNLALNSYRTLGRWEVPIVAGRSAGGRNINNILSRRLSINSKNELPLWKFVQTSKYFFQFQVQKREGGRYNY